MQQNKQWQEELSILASIIEKANLEKAIKWGSEVFTYNGKNVISYGGFKNYFALWFFNGVFLKRQIQSSRHCSRRQNKIITSLEILFCRRNR